MNDMKEVEAVADAIDGARYQHPDNPRERPRPFSEADRSDREYAIRLARAALSAALARQSEGREAAIEECDPPSQAEHREIATNVKDSSGNFHIAMMPNPAYAAPQAPQADTGGYMTDEEIKAEKAIIGGAELCGHAVMRRLCPECSPQAPQAGERSADKLWRYLNGYDITDFDKRAEHLMMTTLDGLTIGPTNRNSVKLAIVGHFEQIAASALPPPQTDVTPEMVKRALDAWFSGSQSESDMGLERSMKAAIEAAGRPQAPQAEGWLPISSAPKDGTRIIGTDGLAVEVIYNAEGTGWFNQSCEMSMWRAFPPSHWQPLPTPPLVAEPKG